MKKVTVFLLLFVMLFSFVSCAEQTQSDKLQVYATNFTPFDFVRQIGGERVEVTMLISPGSESHYYEASLATLSEISAADLFIYVGGESDAWVENSREVLTSDDLVCLPLIDRVATLQEELAEGMEAEDGEEEAVADEHIWTSPRNAKIIAEEICDALCRLAPESEGYFKENLKKLSKDLDGLDTRIQSIVANGERKTIVFAERFPFLYLARHYGLDYFAAFAGCSTQNEPSLQTVSFLIDKIETENIPVVFTIEFSNGKTADTICESSGCKKLLLHSCHNVSKSDFDNGVTYVDLMKQNADHLEEALN